MLVIQVMIALSPMSVTNMKAILTNGLHLTNLTVSLKSLLVPPLFCVDHIPFMGTSNKLFIPIQSSDRNTDEARLNCILSGIGALRIPVEGDGFVAVAI